MSPTSTNKLAVTTPSDLEIQLVREFDAPRTLLFDVMTDLAQRKHWWGPRGYEVLEAEMDFRVGGSWRMVQRDPEGNVWPFKGEYLEVAPPERIVQTFIFDVEPYDAYPARETLTLEELAGNRSRLNVVVRHLTKESRDGHLMSGMESGAGETYDRLEELLGTLR